MNRIFKYINFDIEQQQYYMLICLFVKSNIKYQHRYPLAAISYTRQHAHQLQYHTRSSISISKLSCSLGSATRRRHMLHCITYALGNEQRRCGPPFIAPHVRSLGNTEQHRRQTVGRPCFSHDRCLLSQQRNLQERLNLFAWIYIYT